MARLALTAQTPLGSYPALPLVANSADFTWVASGADFADGAGVTLTGRELVLIRNDNAGAQTVTFTATPDAYGREENITAYSIGIGEYAMFGPFKPDGWMQTDGRLYFAVSAADLYLAVIRIPAGYA